MSTVRFRARFLALALLGALVAGCETVPQAMPAPPPVSGDMSVPTATPTTTVPAPAFTPAAPEATSLALGTPTPLTSAQTTMTFMTFNVRQADCVYTHYPGFPDGARAYGWTNSRAPAVVSYVKKANPDVVGFQEVNNSMRDGNGKRIPGQQITALRQGLPEYTFVRTTNSNDVQPIAFKTSKYTLVDHGRVQVQKKGQGSDGNRFMTWAILKDTKGLEFLVANIWPNDGNTAQWAAGRAEAWPGIINSLSTLSRNGTMPAVLLGDFNSPANRPKYPYQVFDDLLTKDGWNDSRLAPDDQTPLKNVSSAHGWGQKMDGTYIPHLIAQVNYVIDYIWAKNATPLTYKIDVPDFTYKTVNGTKYPIAQGLIPSDHWPIVSKIAFD